VLKWGAKAEVLAPESLRQEVRREAEEMLKVYKRVTPRKGRSAVTTQQTMMDGQKGTTKYAKGAKR